MAVEAAANVSRFTKSLQSEEAAPLDMNSPYEFNPGAKLVVRSSLDVDVIDVDVLAKYFQSRDYDVKDINVSVDGSRLIFAAHGPEGDVSHASWNIYEYRFDTQVIRRIIEDDVIANSGHDASPTYTLDGLVV